MTSELNGIKRRIKINHTCHKRRRNIIQRRAINRCTRCKCTQRQVVAGTDAELQSHGYEIYDNDNFKSKCIPILDKALEQYLAALR